jgi:nucleotidyltransferase substrate binding protein (TIGR01987 family)
MQTRPDIRWKQRLANLTQAFALLEEALSQGIGNLNQLEKEGLAQRFEFTFELAWKTLKDYLEDSGVSLEISTPREVIKEAFSANIIANGTMWIKMLDHRNLLSHTYDVKRFDEAVRAIDAEYTPVLRDAVEFFHQRVNE